MHQITNQHFRQIILVFDANEKRLTISGKPFFIWCTQEDSNPLPQLPVAPLLPAKPHEYWVSPFSVPTKNRFTAQ